MEKLHIPVMLKEVMEAMQVKEGGVYADLTFGEGGHTEAFLKAGAARVVGNDQDTEALGLYKEGGNFRADPRLELRHGRLSTFAETYGEPQFDAMLVDLGISTRQVLKPERGFSFNHAGPLNMQMDPEGDFPLLKRLEETSADNLAAILDENADLKGSRGLARKISEAVSAGRLSTTLDLADLAGPRHGKRHPATTLFMALRMWVNRELEEVTEGLPTLLKSLKPGGRLAVLSFHSTEDRAVKKCFLALGGRCACDRDSVVCLCPKVQQVQWILKKPLIASREEQRTNPRSRSAKLRCVEKL